MAEMVDPIEQVYREQSARIWRALLLYSGDPEVASDSTAEAFAQLIARGPLVRDPAAWVWRSAFKIAGGELLEKRTRAASSEPIAALPVEMPAQTVDLVRALERLSPAQRRSVVLRYYGGYTNVEIARILGSTPPAIGVHLFRARLLLATALQEHDDG
jgi:RNA polymerase sigma factor (sigma-70 family)